MPIQTVQKDSFMNFRGRRASTPRNDGLPVIHGKKVKRRQKFGSQNFVHRKSSSSFLTYFWRFAIVAIILFVFVLKNDEGNEVPKKEVASKPATAAKAPETKPTPPETKAAPPPPKPQPTGPDGFPAKCNDNQLSLYEKQFPVDELGHRAWRDASFTKATVRTKYAYNPKIAREFYASDDFKLDATHSFYAVSIGWNNNDVPIDMLAIGSRDTTKYDTNKWNDEVSLPETLRLPSVAIDAAASKRPAKFLVVDLDKDSGIRKIKSTFGLGEELYVVTSDLKSLSKNVADQKPGVNGVVATDQPIHYLDIYSPEGLDAYMLKAMVESLSEVRFLHFQYNKGGSWEYYALSDVMHRFREYGLVCYFAGSKEVHYDLWRITDCFMDHFDQPHWAGIACVNVQLPDVRQLAERMEATFLKTLEKDQSFSVG